jgi:hypothetical protein
MIEYKTLMVFWCWYYVVLPIYVVIVRFVCILSALRVSSLQKKKSKKFIRSPSKFQLNRSIRVRVASIQSCKHNL